MESDSDAWCRKVKDHSMFVARRIKVLAGIGVALLVVTLGPLGAWAKDVKITIPLPSELTPVQRLNRDGVEAVKKHQYRKAEALFQKAYLYDPSDPFTLNNLGYVSELEGRLDRAETFYRLSAEQGSSANIDLTSLKQLKGKPMADALNTLKNTPMRVNGLNVEAVELLARGESGAAIAHLQQALSLEPHNPFTLNNLGVAHEAMGDYENALKYYNAAAASQSQLPVILTATGDFEGKPVSEVAAESARRLEVRLSQMTPNEVRARALTLKGVSAVNQNNWAAAKKDFLEAYALDPESGFALNNRGYVAEREGDLETAQYFYGKAQAAADANAVIGIATNHAAEGKQVISVASGSGQKVGGELAQYSQERRRQTGPILLIPRGEPESTTAPGNPPPSNPAPAAPPVAPQPPQ